MKKTAPPSSERILTYESPSNHDRSKLRAWPAAWLWLIFTWCVWKCIAEIGDLSDDLQRAELAFHQLLNSVFAARYRLLQFATLLEFVWHGLALLMAITLFITAGRRLLWWPLTILILLVLSPFVAEAIRLCLLHSHFGGFTYALVQLPGHWAVACFPGIVALAILLGTPRRPLQVAITTLASIELLSLIEHAMALTVMDFHSLITKDIIVAWSIQAVFSVAILSCLALRKWRVVLLLIVGKILHVIVQTTVVSMNQIATDRSHFSGENILRFLNILPVNLVLMAIIWYWLTQPDRSKGLAGARESA